LVLKGELNIAWTQNATRNISTKIVWYKNRWAQQ